MEQSFISAGGSAMSVPTANGLDTNGARRLVLTHAALVCERRSADLEFDPPGRADTGRGSTAGR